MTKASRASTATIAMLIAIVAPFGAVAKLIARMSAPTITTDSTPPRLSTFSVASLTCAGTNTRAITSAIPTRGRVIRKTDPHQKCSRRAPATSGPSDAMPPPIADQSAIDFVRPGPAHSAVIRASVVGYAIPAEMPPSTRAPNSTPAVGAYAASRQAGTDSAMPAISSSLRP